MYTAVQTAIQKQLLCYVCNSLLSLLLYIYRHTVIQVITQYLT